MTQLLDKAESVIDGLLDDLQRHPVKFGIKVFLVLWIIKRLRRWL